MPLHLFRAASLDRGFRRTSKRQRQERNLRPRLAIDQLESRIALAITTPLSIGGTTVASFFDAPTGPANLGDFVTVSIEGTKGTVIFNGGKGVADGTDIQTVEILDASPDFQLTFNATITTANPVPYASDGVVQLGQITTANVIRGINTVRGPLTNVAAPWEIETSAIHLYTFNDGTVSGTTVSDLIGGADGELVNGATVSGGSLVLAENPGPATGAGVQYMQMPAGVLPQGSTAATFELWFTASNTTGVWGRGFDLGRSDQQYLMFTPLSAGGGSRAAITESSSGGERLVDGVTPYNDNTQHLATVTVDDPANTLTYYIDGVSLGSVSLDGTFLSGLEAINNFLGRSQFAQDPGFIGSMNQFAIYDRVLSSTEVAANYAAGPITAPLSPLGFTQSTPGSGFLELEGDQTLVFPVGSFVCATPLLPATTPLGSPSFATVTSVAFDSITNKTTITVDNATAAGTTAGALTLAETIQPEFRLQSFVGVNFSNRTLKEGGGLFVDVVEGGDVVYRGETLQDVGILLSQGLLAYSTIGIRRQLAADVLLGLSSTASTDGRMFVESATPESVIVLGTQRAPTALNSKFQLTGGEGPFGAGLFSYQAFNGVVNLRSAATGGFLFSKGVGPQAALNASGWNSVLVAGDFAGAINSTSDQLRLTVGRNVAGTARINAASDVSLNVAGSILKGAVVTSDQGTTFVVGGNVLGTIQAGSSEMSGAVGGNVSGAKIASSNDISLAVAGSILNSTIQADDEFTLDVARNVTGSTLSSGDSEIVFNVGGNVANSRFLGGLSGTIGGNVTKSFFVAKGESLDDEDPDITLDVAGSMTSSHVEATSRVSVDVDGSVTRSKFISTTSGVTVDVGSDIKDSTLISADDGVTLSVGRDALNTTVIGDDEDTELTIGRNFSGAVQNGSESLLVRVGGSVLKGSTFVTGDDALIDVGRNFDGSVTSDRLRFLVDGNVSQASRIVAQRVNDWQAAGDANFGVGGRFDGILNATYFDGYDGYTDVTLVGGGVGSSGRFNVGQFDTDNLFFNGNFNGNLRVGQDLVANLNFGGNVDRITIAGRVGSYAAGNAITPVPVAINVAGRLRYLNSNSYFQAAVAGVNGTFYNDALGTQSTGLLSTLGGYTTVVPTLQVVPAPTPPGPQVYSVPSVPLGFSAAPIAPPTTTGGPSANFAPYAAIKVSFSAPASDGGLPVVFYEYTTNLLDGTPSWRRFDNPAQGPGTDILLTCDSAGGAWINGNTYQVSVRAVNAIGPSTAPTAVPVTVTLPSP